MVSLGFIFFQDFAERAISLYTLIALSVICLVIFSVNSTDILNVSLNFGFILFNIAMIWVYLSFKLRTVKVSIKDYIGSGDFYFWVPLIFLYDFQEFVPLFIISIIFSLLLHLLLIFFDFYKIKDMVPLAGFQSLFFIFVFSKEIFDHLKSLFIEQS